MKKNEKGLWYLLNDLNLEEPRVYLLKLYNSGMSFNHISEYLFEKYEIIVTPKGIEYYIPSELRRTRSEAKKLAIKTKRMIYKKKSKHGKYSAKGIPTGIRLKVLQRDNFECQFCGNGRKTGYSLELHHKNGDESTEDNLQTLCFLCHRGLHSNNNTKSSAEKEADMPKKKTGAYLL